MAPRRQINQRRVEEIYERNNLDQRIGDMIEERLEQRIGQMIDQRIDAAVAQITERVEALAMNQNRGRNPNPNLNPNPNMRVGADFEEDDDEMLSAVEGYYDESLRRRGRPCVEVDYRRWEMGMKTEIPKFHGTLQPEEVLDWLDEKFQVDITEKIEEYVDGDGFEADDGPIFHIYVDEKEEDEVFEAGGNDEPVFDDEYEEEFPEGDGHETLVVRRSCMTPKVAEEDWLRTNIFQSICTIWGKVCRFMVDSGSCENIISTEAVQKLGVQIEQHPKPYKLAWLKKGGEVSVSKRAFITFSIGVKYRDSVWCDVIAMDACHLLLGRLWQFDRGVTHDGRADTYSFTFKGVRIVQF